MCWITYLYKDYKSKNNLNRTEQILIDHISRSDDQKVIIVNDHNLVQPTLIFMISQLHLKIIYSLLFIWSIKCMKWFYMCKGKSEKERKSSLRSGLQQIILLLTRFMAPQSGFLIDRRTNHGAVIKTDICLSSRSPAAFLKAAEAFGGIDILFNNAGILNEDMWEKTVSINLVRDARE